MDTFTTTKGSVVGPYDDSVSIDASGPVSISGGAIDTAGDIAGSFTDETGTHAVLERGGSTTIFDGAPGAQYTSPEGIDAAGDVIGDYTLVVNGSYVDHAFVYRDGAATTVGPSTWTSSVVEAVNAAGTFAGSYTDAAGDHAFVDAAGAISSFDAPMGDFPANVEAIDANGDVAGFFEQSDYSHFEVYLDQNGKLSTVALPSDTEQAGITGVDAAGTVVGYYFTSETSDSGVPAYFIANPASTTDPGPKPITVPAGGTLVDALGFDPQGDVVGTYYDPATGGDRIFRTDALGVSTPVAGPPGATSTVLTGIEPDGTLFGSYQDANGSHLFTDRAGVVTTVPAVPNSRDPSITGEDAAGDVTGEYTKVFPSAVDPTFLYQNGASAPLTLPGRPLGASLFAIDTTGDIVGTTQDADGIHMFVDEGGTVTTQDAAPGAYSTTPVYLDDAGDIIGHYTASDGTERLFVDKNGAFTTVNIPPPAGKASLPFIQTADANGDFAGAVEFVSTSAPEDHYFADIGGAVKVFDLPNSVGIFPELVGMDPQGDIGIEGSGPSNGQAVSSLRMADGSYQAIVVPGSVAQSTALQRIDRAGNYIGTYQAPSAGGGAPVTLGFVRLASSGAYVTVAPPAGVNSFSPRVVDATGDVFGSVTNSDYSYGIFEQKAGAAQGAVVPLGSGTGREFLMGVDAAGDIAANAYSTQAYQDGPTQAYLVIGGQVTAIEGSPSATSTTIQSIDAAGDILGTYTDGTGEHNFATFASSAPRISNTHASSTSAEAPVPPFAAVTVQDLRDGATDTLTIALSGGGGTLADGSGYGGASTLQQTGPGTYTLTGAATGITAELDALSFTPTAGAPGTPNPTTFTLTDASSVGGSATETVTDAATVVTDTASGAASTGAGTTGTGGVGAGTTSTGGAGTSPTSMGAAGTSTTSAGGAGTSTASAGGGGAPPVPVASDSVSFQRTAGYRHGTFTLGGQASSAAGVTAVEISAVLSDGTRHDLGAATVHPDGTFTFSDAIGADQQSFIEATLTDGAGARTVSPDPLFSLANGLGPHGREGRQTLYADGGDAEAATILSRPNGLRAIRIEAPGQTVALQPYDVVFDHRRGGTRFVYTPGPGTGAVDTVRGFRLGGPDHDTLALPSADFANLAAVLRNTGDVEGSAFITDPKTGDAVRLAGVTTAELKAHPKDIALGA